MTTPARHWPKPALKQGLVVLLVTSLCISCSASTQSDNAVTQSENTTSQPDDKIVMSEDTKAPDQSTTTPSANTIECLYTEGTQTTNYPADQTIPAVDNQDYIAVKSLIKVWKSPTDDRYRVLIASLDGQGIFSEAVNIGDNAGYSKHKGPGEPYEHYVSKKYARRSSTRHYIISPMESDEFITIETEMTDGLKTSYTWTRNDGFIVQSYVADTSKKVQCDEAIFDIDVPPKKPLTDVYLTDCDIALRNLMQAQVIEHAMEHHINELREQSTNGLAPADLEFAISEYDNMLNDLFAHVYEPLDTIEATCPTTGHAAQAHETAEVIRTSLAAMREAQAKLVAECEGLEGREAPVELTK